MAKKQKNPETKPFVSQYRKKVRSKLAAAITARPEPVLPAVDLKGSPALPETQPAPEVAPRAASVPPEQPKKVKNARKALAAAIEERNRQLDELYP